MSQQEAQTTEVARVVDPADASSEVQAMLGAGEGSTGGEAGETPEAVPATVSEGPEATQDAEGAQAETAVPDASASTTAATDGPHHGRGYG